MRRQAVDQAEDVDHLNLLRQLAFVCRIDAVSLILKKRKDGRPQVVTIERPRFVETPRGLYIRNGTRAFAPRTQILSIVMTCSTPQCQDTLYQEKWVRIPELGFVQTKSRRVQTTQRDHRRIWRRHHVSA